MHQTYIKVVTLFQSAMIAGLCLFASAAPVAAADTTIQPAFAWPVKKHLITQYYGPSHHAIDVSGTKKTQVLASEKGMVTIAQCGWNAGYGCYVVINNGGGFETLYAHLSSIKVKLATEVAAGQVLGLMGDTGNLRGKNPVVLHFELKKDGQSVDPLTYLK